jgi:hypothetical protein
LQDFVARICEYVKRGEMALFVGAGVSKDPPSCLPLGSEIKKTLIEGFCADYPSDVKDLIIEYAIADLSLEEVCGVIYEEMSEQLITTMASALDDEELQPDMLHLFVAKTLSLGNIVVTTNYDRQIERAYLKKDLKVCYDKKTFGRFVDKFRKRKGVWLLKLHGTFKIKKGNTIRDVSESVRTTIDRVGRGLPVEVEKALKATLRKFPILFIGYGCGDVDIVYPILASVKSKKEIFWVKHDGKKLLYVGEDTRNLKNELPHIANVLVNRGKTNNGKVSLIMYPTLEFIEKLAAKLGWELAPRKSGGLSESHWREQLLSIGYQANKIEKASVLATLSMLGADTEKGREKKQQLIQLAKGLYGEALEMAEEPFKKARLHRGLGFTIYLSNPTDKDTIEKAVEHYGIAEELLEKVSSEKLPVLDKLELLSLKALAYRRSYQIMKAFKYSSLVWEAIPHQIQDQLEKLHQNSETIKYKNQELSDRQKSNLGNVLRRVADVLSAFASDPATLSTAVKGPIWKIHPIEKRILKEALKLARSSRKLQILSGNIRERIQSEHILGLVATKLNKTREAKRVHTKSKEDAFLLNWIGREYAQACRNLGLVLEKEDLEKGLVELKEAEERFSLKGDRLITAWHIGRILIKKEDEGGVSKIEEIMKERKPHEWHMKCNDLVFLGIGYCDLKKEKAIAENLFKQMLEIYENVNDDLVMSMPYGVDNALANIEAAYFRLCLEGNYGNDELCKRFRCQEQRLEKMREEKINYIKKFLK